jgi:RHH-type proline utilization regulon transcriptional repressor/proline dehydrogenase/delta 1-pyrroline-5-carboxylate dehydrogenase
MTAFRNEPLLELRSAAVRQALVDALGELDARLPVQVPILVGDERRSGETFASVDPGRPDQVVAVSARARASDVDDAVAAAERGFRAWSSRSASERAASLARAAGVMRARRLDLTALAVRECAKPWPEADADVCEAIDFLEYYAERAEMLAHGIDLVHVPGERNRMRYAPRGVVAVIAPWNFPLAIPVGMVAAALATGNTVVLKPAEQSPACGLAVALALREAGVPDEALSFLPGADDPGRALVRHPRVQTIAFTGSGRVGLEIVRAAGEVAAGQQHLKRVIAEMGGKNCIVVDSDADLDDAIPAIVKSAFGFAGQKCSAASRVLAHDAVADVLTERLAGCVQTLQVGQAERFGIDVPPVIDQEAQQRTARYVELARRDGRVAAQAAVDPSEGYFARPTLITGLPPGSPIIEDEIFGPVLTLERVSGVEEACEVVERSPFALTGGLFCRNPDTVEAVAERSPVGNLYVNREITGAMVGRHPFGGNRLSGTGTKAGGPDYLLQFVEPRVVCENTVRHGLVV